MPQVILTDQDNAYITNITNIENKDNFSYFDDEKNYINIKTFDDGITLNKKAKDYELELNLRKDGFVKIINCEGIMNFDIKVVDFILNNDNMLVRYLVEGQEKKLEIKY